MKCLILPPNASILFALDALNLMRRGQAGRLIIRIELKFNNIVKNLSFNVIENNKLKERIE